MEILYYIMKNNIRNSKSNSDSYYIKTKCRHENSQWKFVNDLTTFKVNDFINTDFYDLH